MGPASTSARREIMGGGVNLYSLSGKDRWPQSNFYAREIENFSGLPERQNYGRREGAEAEADSVKATGW